MTATLQARHTLRRRGIVKAALFLVFLLSGCNAFEPAKRSSWAYKGHEYVNCPDRKMIKMCEQAGPYMICECAMR